jgi:hypothetical protein
MAQLVGLAGHVLASPAGDGVTMAALPVEKYQRTRRDSLRLSSPEVNLRIVNSLGATETKNRLGNLIVGYNEKRTEPKKLLTTTPLHLSTRTPQAAQCPFIVVKGGEEHESKHHDVYYKCFANFARLDLPRRLADTPRSYSISGRCRCRHGNEATHRR